MNVVPAKAGIQAFFYPSDVSARPMEWAGYHAASHSFREQTLAVWQILKKALDSRFRGNDGVNSYLTTTMRSSKKQDHPQEVQFLNVVPAKAGIQDLVFPPDVSTRPRGWAGYHAASHSFREQTLAVWQILKKALDSRFRGNDGVNSYLTTTMLPSRNDNHPKEVRS